MSFDIRPELVTFADECRTDLDRALRRSDAAERLVRIAHEVDADHLEDLDDIEEHLDVETAARWRIALADVAAADPQHQEE